MKHHHLHLPFLLLLLLLLRQLLVVVAELELAARASIPAPVLKMIEQIRQSVIPDLSVDGKLHGEERKVATFRAIMQQKRLFHEFPDPDYSKRPNVNLAACAGLRVYFVRWRLHDGNLVLRCRCGGALRP